MLVLGAAVTMTSCKKDPLTVGPSEDVRFLLYDAPSVLTKGAIVHVFDEVNDQYSFSEDQTYFFVTNASQSAYAEFTLAATPSATPVALTVKAVGIPELQDGAYSVILAQTKGNLVWLWDEAKQAGFIMQCK